MFDPSVVAPSSARARWRGARGGEMTSSLSGAAPAYCEMLNFPVRARRYHHGRSVGRDLQLDVEQSVSRGSELVAPGGRRVRRSVRRTQDVRGSAAVGACGCRDRPQGAASRQTSGNSRPRSSTMTEAALAFDGARRAAATQPNKNARHAKRTSARERTSGPPLELCTALSRTRDVTCRY